MNFWSLFFSVVLCGWIVLGSYVYTCKIWELCDSSSDSSKKPSIVQKNTSPKDTLADKKDLTDSIPQTETLKEKETTAPKDELLEKSHLVYFELMSTQMILTPEHEAFFKVLKEYLAKSTENKLTITGHTDNVGTPERNVEFGRKRAESVKNYLVTMGFSANQLVIDSKGQEQALESNDSEEGRAKNRRVELKTN